MGFRDNIQSSTQRTPRSAARQSERDGRQLDSPQHRRIPEQYNNHAPVPFALPNVNQTLDGSVSSDADPFHVVPHAPNVQRESSRTRAISALADLRAQAAATSALLRPVRHRGRHNQLQDMLPQMPMPPAQDGQGHAPLQFNNMQPHHVVPLPLDNQHLHHAAQLIPHPVRNIIPPPPPPPPPSIPVAAAAPLPLA